MAPAPSKPWSVDIFQEHRAHLCGFVDEKLVPLLRALECYRILVRAPVKSGKREIAEYAAMRDRVAGRQMRVHAFISAWHRKADEEQRDELTHHNLAVFSIINQKEVARCLQWIRAQLITGHRVVIHLDECDHGTGSRQLLGQIWSQIRETDNLTTVLYSATPEEVLFSAEVDDRDYTEMVATMISTGCSLRYDPVYYDPTVDPTTGFCGPKAFLDAGLVEDATPFFRKRGDTIALTAQGRQIVAGLRDAMTRNAARNIIVLRLSYSKSGASANRKERKAIYEFLRHVRAFPELAGFLVKVDKDENFDGAATSVLKERIQWSNTEYWRATATGIPILIVVDQTSTRSTEWACHDRIYAVHDFRNILNFGTISQAQERVNHYANRYGGFQPIRVFGSRKTFLLSAERISYQEYLTNEWYMRKVNRRRAGDADVYEIKKTGTHELHPAHTEPVSQADAEEILQDLASFADPALSARVRGNMRECAIVETTFHAATAATFEAVAAGADFATQSGGHRFQNPFQNPRMDGGRFMGYLREWRVFDYDEIKESRWGFNRTTNGPRLTVCYKDGVLGVALRTLAGFETVNTLVAYHTMYETGVHTR